MICIGGPFDKKSMECKGESFEICTPISYSMTSEGLRPLMARGSYHRRTISMDNGGDAEVLVWNSVANPLTWLLNCYSKGGK